MKPTNPEILAIDNTLKLLRKGKFEMEGEECLAFYRVFEFWAKRLMELQKPPVVATPVVEPIKTPEPSKKKKK